MSVLERKIAELAEAMRARVVIGRQGHKDEWFAHCDGVETASSTASAALRDLTVALQRRAGQQERELAKARDLVSRLQGVNPAEGT